MVERGLEPTSLWYQSSDPSLSPCWWFPSRRHEAGNNLDDCLVPVFIVTTRGIQVREFVCTDTLTHISQWCELNRQSPLSPITQHISQSQTHSSLSSFKLRTMAFIGQNSRIPSGDPLYHTMESAVSSKNVETKCHHQAFPGPSEMELQLLSHAPFLNTSTFFPKICVKLKGWFFRNIRDLLIFLYSGWSLSPVNMVPCLPPLSELGTRRNLYKWQSHNRIVFFCTLHLRGSWPFVSCKWQSSFSGFPSCLGRNVTAQLVSNDVL